MRKHPKIKRRKEKEIILSRTINLQMFFFLARRTAKRKRKKLVYAFR